MKLILAILKNVLQSDIDKVPYKLTDSTISTSCMNAANNTIPLWIEPKKGAHKKKNRFYM